MRQNVEIVIYLHSGHWATGCKPISWCCRCLYLAIFCTTISIITFVFRNMLPHRHQTLEISVISLKKTHSIDLFNISSDTPNVACIFRAYPVTRPLALYYIFYIQNSLQLALHIDPASPQRKCLKHVFS